MKPQQLLLIIFGGFLSSSLLGVNSLLSPTRISKQSITAMYGAFNKRNKQGDLLKKMEEARKQREMTEENGSSDGSPHDDYAKSKGKRISDEELKRENDMKRFEQLLNSESATINYDLDSANYMTKQQEEEEIDAGCK